MYREKINKRKSCCKTIDYSPLPRPVPLRFPISCVYVCIYAYMYVCG